MYFHIEEHLVEVEPALARIAKVEVAHQSLAGTAGIVLVVGGHILCSGYTAKVSHSGFVVHSTVELVGKFEVLVER